MCFKKLLSIVMGCFFALNVLGTNKPEVIEDENGELTGIKLHLPEGLIADCEDKYWTLKEEEKAELDACLPSEIVFQNWCDGQKKPDNTNPVKLRKILGMYAYILSHVSKSNWTLQKKFCKDVGLIDILGSIHLKGAKRCSHHNFTDVIDEYLTNMFYIFQD